MLNPDLPPDRIDSARAVVEPLLERLRSQTRALPVQSDSALIYQPISRSSAPEESL